MQLTKEEAKELVHENALTYYQDKLREKRSHDALKRAIKRAKVEGNLTQQEIADETVIDMGEETFDLSRQRISQIINE